ncbi:Domain of uncharacterised function (DUF2825) [Actinomyces slackii]|uniref:Domain of uncharacterized function (DUF2825) n=1 Tax=Actinomyces slackii TaxID=52774 RepID=A0A3S4WH24_9ACTO|nr:Domain of uncharacterised function (DUF2825) [Actinomyces slackii]
MRGVYFGPLVLGEAWDGSSPRARGLHGRAVSELDAGRIIPACAGFTPLPAARWRRWRDHPRVRGVYVSLCVAVFGFVGSSPRARGLPNPTLNNPRTHGIIPACAGFTTETSIGGGALPDHPRVRGVYPPASSQVVPMMGSSPRARGLRCDGVDRGCLGRIIPACAGFTDRPGGAQQSAADHPRVRGVYPVVMFAPPYSVGSSPRARGLPRRALGGLGRPGIIPACAGFTGIV